MQNKALLTQIVDLFQKSKADKEKIIREIHQ